MLCQALQMKSQDILNALYLVLITKILLQKLRKYGWNTFLKYVELFCEMYDLLYFFLTLINFLEKNNILLEKQVMDQPMIQVTYPTPFIILLS